LFDHRKINPHIDLGILDLVGFSGIRGLTAKREIERAGTQYVLQQLLNTNDDILDYTSFKKPFLKKRNEHISISHSHGKLAIILNKKQPTGIDIELVRDKVLNIQEKFLSEREMLFARNKVDKLLTIWAAKEAMYKVYGEKEIEFARHLQVENFNGSEIQGSINMDNFKKKFLLIAENIENYKMVYVLDEI
jgi:4'-phosphopantetheinyl transferase